jgi:hypothetical protein
VNDERRKGEEDMVTGTGLDFVSENGGTRRKASPSSANHVYESYPEKLKLKKEAKMIEEEKREYAFPFIVTERRLSLRCKMRKGITK